MPAADGLLPAEAPGLAADRGGAANEEMKMMAMRHREKLLRRNDGNGLFFDGGGGKPPDQTLGAALARPAIGVVSPGGEGFPPAGAPPSAAAAPPPVDGKSGSARRPRRGNVGTYRDGPAKARLLPTEFERRDGFETTALVPPEGGCGDFGGGLAAGGGAMATATVVVDHVEGARDAPSAQRAVVTPVAAAPPPSASRGGAVRANVVPLVFETPRKPPHPSSSKRAVSNSSAAVSKPYHTGITPFLASHGIHATPANSGSSRSPSPPQQYSPITPNTAAYMSSNSPFKHSMRLLDDGLSSVMRMNTKLDTKITGVAEMYYHEDLEVTLEVDESDEEEEEGGSGGDSDSGVLGIDYRGLYGGNGADEKKKSEKKAKRRARKSERKKKRRSKDKENVAASGNSNKGGSVLSGLSVSDVSELTADTAEQHQLAMAHRGGIGRSCEPDGVPETRGADGEEDSFRTAAVADGEPSPRSDFQTPVSTDTGPGALPPFGSGAASCASISSVETGNGYKNLHYLNHHNAAAVPAGRRGQGGGNTAHSVDDTIDSGVGGYCSGSVTSSSVKLRRVLWRGFGGVGGDDCATADGSSRDVASVEEEEDDVLPPHPSSSPRQKDHQPATPLAPKQLYQGRVDEVGLSCSSEDEEDVARTLARAEVKHRSEKREQAASNDGLRETPTKGTAPRNFAIGDMFKRMKVGGSGGGRTQHQPTSVTSTVESSAGAVEVVLSPSSCSSSPPSSVSGGQGSPLPQQRADAQLRLDQLMAERDQLLATVSELRGQLSDAARDREDLVEQRDLSDARAQEHEDRTKVLSREVKALESEVEGSLRLVQQVQEEASASLRKEREAKDELIGVLAAKEDEIARSSREAEERRLADLESLRLEMESSLASALEDQARELSASHAAELGEAEARVARARSMSLAAIERARREGEAKRVEDAENARAEAEASLALALEGQARELAALHAAELEELRSELQLSSSPGSSEMKEADEGITPFCEEFSPADDCCSDDCSEGVAEDRDGEEKGEGASSSSEEESFSFYIGQEEGFVTSTSVDESEFSETDSDAEDGDDDGLPSCESYSAADTSVISKSVRGEQESTPVMNASPSALSSEERAPCHTSSSLAPKSAEVKDELASAEAENERLIVEIKRLQLEHAAERSALCKEIEEGKDQVRALQEKIEDVECVANSLSLEMENLREEKAGIEHRLDAASADRDDLFVEVERLTKSLNEGAAERETLDACRDTLDIERVSLLNQVKQLEQQLASQRGVVESLREEANERGHELREVMEKEEAAQKRIASLSETVHGLQSSLAERDSRLAEMAASKEELVESFLQLGKEREAIISEKNMLGVEVVEKSALVSSLEAQNETLSSLINELRDQNVAVAEQMASIDDQRSEAISSNGRNEEKVRTLEEQIGETKLQLQDVVAQKNELSSSKQRLEQTISDLQVKHKSLSSSIESHEADIDSLKDQIFRLESENEGLLKDMAGRDRALKSNECEISSLKKKLMAAEAELRSLREKLAIVANDKSEAQEQLAKANEEIDSKIRREVELIALTEQLVAERSSLEESMKSMQFEQKSSWETVAELNANIVHLKSQIDLESNMRADHLEEKSNLERQLVSAREERDSLFAEVNQLKEKLSFSVAEGESKVLQLDDARLQVAFRANRVHELEHELAQKCAADESPEKSDLAAERDHFQELAANLAVSVLKLKMQRKKSRKGRVVPSDETVLLKQALDEVKADRKSLAAAHLQQHEKLVAVRADNKVLLETLMLHEKDFERSLEIQLKSIPSLHADDHDHSSSSHTDERMKLMVSKLALSLVKMKARDMNLSKEKSALLDREKSAAADLEQVSQEKVELTKQIGAMSERVAKLEEAISAKDDNLQELHATIMNKTGMLIEIRQENDLLKEGSASMSRELESKKASLAKNCALIERLQSENESLGEVSASLQLSRTEAFELKNQLERANDDLLELQAAKLSVENRLEQLSADKGHLSTEIDSMHDTIATLEAGKESLATTLQGYKERTVELSSQVTALEDQSRSSKRHIANMECQLESKASEAEELAQTVRSQEETLKELRDQFISIQTQKADVEGMLSSLHSKMEHIVNERDDLSSQLEKAVEELDVIREERKTLAAKLTEISIVQHPSDHSFKTLSLGDGDSDSPPIQVHFEVSPRKEIRELLNSSCISEREVDEICDKMTKAQSIIAQIEQERKLLRKEVKHLRAGLELARGELTTVKKDFKKASGQVSAMRDALSRAKTLLQKTEEEKNQLAADLDSARTSMERIQASSSQFHSSAFTPSRDDEMSNLNIGRLLMSTSIDRSGNAAHNAGTPKLNDISKYDISFETAARTPASRFTTPKVASKVNSKERFKVEKGSVFDILRSTKKSGRKGVKYRRDDESPLPSLHS